MKVAAIQHDIVWEQPEENHARLAPMIAAAANDGARLVALTEMYATGFSMNAVRIAEPIDGPSTTFLAEQARTHGIWVGGSIPTRSATGALPTNRFVLAAPDGAMHRYDKLHPFSYSGEDEHYRGGESTLTIDVEGVQVTPFVCYDLRFADDFWAEAEHTDLYVVVANWPASRREHWQTLLRARAIENQAYVLGVNRCGRDPKLGYSGRSLIVDPRGEVVADAGSGEGLLRADLDRASLLDYRRTFPVLPDIHPEYVRAEP